MNGSVRGNSNEPNQNPSALAPPDLRNSGNNRVLDGANSQSSKFSHAPVIRSSS